MRVMCVCLVVVSFEVLLSVIGLDFGNLYQMTEVLSQAGLSTDAAFTIREHFTVTPGAKSLAEVFDVFLCILYTVYICSWHMLLWLYI